jgi:hypothetical protein
MAQVITQALRLAVLSGHIPATLGDVITFNFDPPGEERIKETGVLFYMINTRDGNRGYRIDVNGHEGDLWSLPPGSHYATLCTSVGPLNRVNNNVLQFRSVGPTDPPMDILHVVLLYEVQAA